MQRSFAINQSTNKTETEHKKDLMTNGTSLCQKITIFQLFILPNCDLPFFPLNCKLKNYLNKFFSLIFLHMPKQFCLKKIKNI